MHQIYSLSPGKVVVIENMAATELKIREQGMFSFVEKKFGGSISGLRSLSVHRATNAQALAGLTDA